MPSLAEMMPSPYINQEDLRNGPVTLTIAGCQIEDIGDKKEQLYCLSFFGTEKRFILKPTNIILLGGLLGEPGDKYIDWINKKIGLYIDTTIMFAGKRTGGLRITAPVHVGSTAPTPTSQTLSQPLGQGPGEAAAAVAVAESRTQNMPTDPDDGIDDKIPF